MFNITIDHITFIKKFDQTKINQLNEQHNNCLMECILEMKRLCHDDYIGEDEEESDELLENAEMDFENIYFIAIYLIEKGINLNQLNKDGLTCYDILQKINDYPFCDVDGQPLKILTYAINKKLGKCSEDDQRLYERSHSKVVELVSKVK
jgi:hypothetical protein